MTMLTRLQLVTSTDAADHRPVRENVYKPRRKGPEGSE